MPPAPPRFSTTTDWPHFAVSRAAIVRAVMSVPPPGANGTMSVTGFVGQACAKAEPARKNAVRDARSLRVFIAQSYSTKTGTDPDFVFAPGNRGLSLFL